MTIYQIPSSRVYLSKTQWEEVESFWHIQSKCELQKSSQ